MSRPRAYLKKTSVGLPPIHAAYVMYHAQVGDLFAQEVLRRIIQAFVDQDCNFQPADFSRFVQNHVIPNERNLKLVEVLKEQVAALLRDRERTDAATETRSPRGLATGLPGSQSTEESQRLL